MELFEQIRREYEHGGGTIRGIAKKLGIHRRMVREAVLSAVPGERKTPVRERPKLEPAMAFIDAVLEADKGATEAAAHRTSDLKKSQAFKSCAPRRRLRKEVQYATRKKTSVGTYG